jgi:hypothetical protein
LFFFFFFFDGFCFLWQLLLDRCIMHQVHTSYNKTSIKHCKTKMGSTWSVVLISCYVPSA